MANNTGQDWTDWDLCSEDCEDLPLGGIPSVSLTGYEYLDPTSLVFDADGCLVAWALLPDAPLIYLRPKAVDGTTGTITPSRDTACSPIKYTKDWTLAAPDNKKATNAAAILGKQCRLIFFEEDTCCNIVLHGAEMKNCGGVTSLSPSFPQPIRFNGVTTDKGTATGGRTNTWTFQSISTTQQIHTTTTPAEIEALRTNTCN